MMQAVKKKSRKNLHILGVTVLTSLDNKSIKEMAIQKILMK